MRKFSSKISRWATALLSLLALSACGKNISKGDARAWFDQHQSSLLKMQKELLEESAIHRIDPEMEVEFVPKYAAFDRRTLEIYRALESQCRSLGIKNVCVSREGGAGDGVVFSVRYILSSVGIAPSSGGFIGIEYTTDSNYIKNMRTNGRILEALGVADWYVVVF